MPFTPWWNLYEGKMASYSSPGDFSCPCSFSHSIRSKSAPCPEYGSHLYRGTSKHSLVTADTIQKRQANCRYGLYCLLPLASTYTEESFPRFLFDNARVFRDFAFELISVFDFPVIQISENALLRFNGRESNNWVWMDT